VQEMSLLSYLQSQFSIKVSYDGYLYLLVAETLDGIWKKVRVGLRAVGNILQSSAYEMGLSDAR
jgi:hypothetical protein